MCQKIINELLQSVLGNYKVFNEAKSDKIKTDLNFMHLKPFSKF